MSSVTTRYRARWPRTGSDDAERVATHRSRTNRRLTPSLRPRRSATERNGDGTLTRQSKKPEAKTRWQLRPLDAKLTFECGEEGVEMKADWVIQRLDLIDDLVKEHAPQISATVRATLEEVMSMVVITDVYRDDETGVSTCGADSDRSRLN